MGMVERMAASVPVFQMEPLMEKSSSVQVHQSSSVQEHLNGI